MKLGAVFDDSEATLFSTRNAPMITKGVHPSHRMVSFRRIGWITRGGMMFSGTGAIGRISISA